MNIEGTLSVHIYEVNWSNRVKGTLFVEIFARTNFRAPSDFDISKTWYMAIQTKTGGRFCENLSRFFLCAKVKKFSTNFRAISRKLRFCAKMRENLSARKFLRITYCQKLLFFRFSLYISNRLSLTLFCPKFLCQRPKYQVHGEKNKRMKWSW